MAHLARAQNGGTTVAEENGAVQSLDRSVVVLSFWSLTDFDTMVAVNKMFTTFFRHYHTYIVFSIHMEAY